MVDRALVSIADWEIVFSRDPGLPPYAPDAYILASLALFSILLCCRAIDADYLHETTMGCLCDLCAYKADRAIKMRSGYLCAMCKNRAASAGVSPIEIDAIQAVLDRVRLLTLGRPPQTELPTADPGGDDEFIRNANLPSEVKLPRRLIDACRKRNT